MPGSFFPPEYKRFAFASGDIVADQDAEGWGLSRILRIDEVRVRRGDTIHIARQPMIATDDDSLLIVACALGGSRYGSLAEARAAAGGWSPDIDHVPMRATFLPPSAVKVAHRPVRDDELAGYRLWQHSFLRGEAGTF